MKLLWVDDEIEELQSQTMFLKGEGVEVVTATNAKDGLELLGEGGYSLVLLDYRMPEMNGIEALRLFRRKHPNVPVALVTMVTDREIIDEAVAGEVVDYIVKPVQPSQILALVRRLAARDVRRKFVGRDLSTLYRRINELGEDADGWLERGRLFLEALSRIEGPERSTLEGQLTASNAEFARWVEHSYPALLENESVLLSHRLLGTHVLPPLNENKPVAFFIFDCFRFNQFLTLLAEMPPNLRISVTPYFSILPTATTFSRNSIFAGQTPRVIARRHPGWLKNNANERELLVEQLNERGYSWPKVKYEKLNTLSDLQNLRPHSADLECYVVNFIDLIFHMRQEVDVLRALGSDTESLVAWGRFVFSQGRFLDKLSDFTRRGYTVFLTSDHGWVIGDTPVVIYGGGELSPALRYKFGDSLRLKGRDALLLRDLEAWGIPSDAKQSRLALATGSAFFVYPSAPRQFDKTYRGGVYHGGISLEEMVLPLVRVQPEA